MFFALLVPLMLAMGLAGCDESGSPPTSPTPPAPMPGGPQVRVGGSVYDTAWRPVPESGWR